MAILTFAIGLALGLAFCFWQRSRFQRQIERLLAELGNNETDSLSAVSQLRRGIVRLGQQNHQLEAELQSWQNILDRAPWGYLQVNAENQLVYCNPPACQWLQVRDCHPDELPLLLKVVRSYELDRLIEETRSRQEKQTCEWVFHPPYDDAEASDRTEAVTLRGCAFPLREGRVGVFLENRQVIVDLARSRERWVSDLAHELRTPLTSIRLVAEALRDRIDPSMSRWVDRLIPETQRLIDLVQDWLELSQLEIDPGRVLRRNPLELESLVRSVWQTLEPIAARKQLRLDYQQPHPIEIEADESRLYRVFLNLFDNAIRYSPTEGTVRVQVATGDSTVEIDIIDEGQGFAEDDIDRVFNRLYRGDPSRSRSSASPDTSSPPGSSSNGLGLAIVRQIIRAHGGAVSARNHPETGGAWLQINLPYH